MACFRPSLDTVFTAYVGVQQHKSSDLKCGHPSKAIQKWLGADLDNAPASVEQFQVIGGDDIPNSSVWVCYWDNEKKYKESMRQLDLRQLHEQLDPEYRKTVGFWCERFTSSISRVETNYTGLDYLPGLARLPGTETTSHTYTAYWGAARDRIPDSAHDLFEEDGDAIATSPGPAQPSLGQHLTGTNYNNLVHIRSGQFWKNCDEEETASYEKNLEPTLREGLAYLWQNRDETGSMGLRYLQNTTGGLPEESIGSKESCVAGFFRNLTQLETWAKRHPSHLAIYTGAIKHAKTFGDQRKFRTWHEVSVLKGGDAHFEYLNCVPHTGVLQGISLTEVKATTSG